MLQRTSQKRHGQEHKGQNCETNHMEKVVYSGIQSVSLFAPARQRKEVWEEFHNFGSLYLSMEMW